MGDRYGWGATVYLDAGEAVAVHRSPASVEVAERAAIGRRSVVRGSSRSAENIARSGRRRRVRMRRYCVANLLTRLVTLTFAPTRRGAGHQDGNRWVCTAGSATDGWCDGCGRPWGDDGRSAALHEGRNWTRRLRDRLGRSFAYVLVAERHKDGHWHLHAALGGDVQEDDVRALWRRGWIDYGKLRRGGSLRDRARAAAAYVAKYAAKDVDGVAVNGQAYRVAEGFDVRCTVVGFTRSLGDLLELVVAAAGEPVSAVWQPGQDDDWRGPPVAVLTLGG